MGALYVIKDILVLKTWGITYCLHSGEKPYTCNVCDKSFTQKDNLNRHKLIHSGDKPHMYHICKKGFQQKTKLKDQLFTHTGEKPYVCDICQRLFVEKCYLAQHLPIYTQVKAKKENLSNHSISRTGCKSLSRDICQYVFTK